VSVRVSKTVCLCWCEWMCVGVGDTVARVCVFVCGYLISWHNCWCACVGVGVSGSVLVWVLRWLGCVFLLVDTLYHGTTVGVSVWMLR